MKTLLGLALIGLIALSCGSSSTDSTQETDISTDTLRFKPVTLAINGMTCQGCEKTIQATVEKINGIQQVEASHALASASIIYDTSQISIVQISEAISELGYEVTGEVASK